jgi:hypothetical protein
MTVNWFAVDGREFFHGFEFHDHAAFHEQVSAEAFFENHPVVFKANDFLPIDLESPFLQRTSQDNFIDRLEDMLPLANTKPAKPAGARWWMKCCTQAKLALPLGGTPYCGKAAGGGVALLAVDADVANLAAVRFDEFLRLHEPPEPQEGS